MNRQPRQRRAGAEGEEIHQLLPGPALVRSHADFVLDGPDPAYEWFKEPNAIKHRRWMDICP